MGNGQRDNSNACRFGVVRRSQKSDSELTNVSNILLRSPRHNHQPRQSTTTNFREDPMTRRITHQVSDGYIWCLPPLVTTLDMAGSASSDSSMAELMFVTDGSTHLPNLS